MEHLKKYIEIVPNHPKPNVNFFDIAPLLANPRKMRELIEELHEVTKGFGATKMGGFDARGFLFGTPLSMYNLLPFFPIRKAGKLPGEVVRQQYGLEYGKDAIEIQKSAINPGDKVILIDDVLATGGTMKAGCEIVKELRGTVVACVTLIELNYLPGREVLKDYHVKSILQYDE